MCSEASVSNTLGEIPSWDCVQVKEEKLKWRIITITITQRGFGTEHHILKMPLAVHGEHPPAAVGLGDGL